MTGVQHRTMHVYGQLPKANEPPSIHGKFPIHAPRHSCLWNRAQRNRRLRRVLHRLKPLFSVEIGRNRRWNGVVILLSFDSGTTRIVDSGLMASQCAIKRSINSRVMMAKCEWNERAPACGKQSSLTGT